MNPMIKNGDWLVLKHNSNDIKIGSIIAYRREQKIIVHRVIKIDHKSLITKGDFNFHVDPVVDVKNIIGKVIAVKNRKRLFRIDTIYWNMVAYIIASCPLIFTRIYRFLS
jgi:signal peptidase